MKKLMKKLIKGVLKFVKHTFLTVWFFTKYLLKGRWMSNFSLKEKNGKTLTLLANAPSLKGVLSRLERDSEFKNTDFVVLNYFANTPEFFMIKPTHYCFADPMFYKKDHNFERVQALFRLLDEKVDWDMNVYIVGGEKRNFKQFSELTNSHLHIHPVNGDEFRGYPCIKNYIYKKGITSPIFSTVAIMAIFVGINSGYSNIRLYGVDHTFFNGLCVNDQNQACMREEHFYETEPTLKPIIKNGDDKIFKMSEYIYSISLMFKSHDQLAAYAASVGTNILNCTECSLIDSYPREKNTKQQNE